MTISAEQIYLLNNMNQTANKVQLGTLIQNAESVAAAEIALAQGSILVGNASGVGSALDAKGNAKLLVGNGTTITSVAMNGEATITNAGFVTIGTIANLRTTDETTTDYYLEIASVGDGGTAMAAHRKLSIDVYNADRTIDLQGNLSIGGDASFAGSVTTLGAWSQVGAHTIEFTTTGNTAITLPTTGTLMTTAAANVFTDDQTIDNAKKLKFRELTANGTNYIGFKAADNMAGDIDYTFPAADAAGVFSSDGAGALSITPLTFTGGHTIGLTTTNNTTLTLPVTGTLATLTGAEVFESKALESSCTIVDATDNAKVLAFDISGMTTAKTVTFTPISDVNNVLKVDFTGSTDTKFLSFNVVLSDDRTITFPDADDTVCLIARAQTLTNKILTSPVINSASHLEVTGTLSQADLNSNIGAGVEVLAAADAGKAYIIDEVELFHDYDSTAYTNAYDLKLIYGTSGTVIIKFADGIVTGGSDDKVFAKPTIYDLDDSTGTAVGFDVDTNAVADSIQFKADTGNYGDGAANNIIKYRIRYHVITALT